MAKVNPATIERRTCAQCGRPFSVQTPQSRRRYCTNQCAKRATRARFVSPKIGAG